jgi:transcriptional regulator with XRE-family HTH domain
MTFSQKEQVKVNQKKEPNVGLRIRELRIRKGYALRALAERCGLSANAISLIERGKNSPTVSTLHRLATSLQVPISDLFNEESGLKAVYVKKGSGLKYQNDNFIMESLGIGLPNQQLEPFRITIEAGADTTSDPITHPGQEFVYCIEGEIKYFVDNQEYRISPGDSLLLDASLPHCWCNTTDIPVSILIIFQASRGRHLARQRHLEL